uniref:dapper homolog 2 n=1 Tax=Pristiophorus japonicus TaxID=55135 RepID=UPI00398E7D59
MLNRRRGSMPAPSAAFDRCRAGERLQAALAGLAELDLLKERQRELVRRALDTEPPRDKCGRDERSRESHSEEQRLEATLSALKEQLSHLRKQDAGLKTHLQHLDRQISELKLDVNKASTEQLESDSRPSSGFYELSDGGSCSLSNSCTSMYSECMSSSQSSLLYSAETRASKSDYRPQSADETTVQLAAFKQQGPAGKRPGQGIKTTTEPLLTFTSRKPGVHRPRPVSTGDLERFVPLRRDFPAASDLKVLPPVCPGGNLQPNIADQKYRCHLVSKNSSDVYNYPSPLHAVALQSPLFCLTGKALSADNRHILSGAAPPNLASRPLETRLGYVSKLTQQHAGGISKAATNRDPETRPKAVMREKDLALPAEAVKNNSNNNTARGQVEKVAVLQWGNSWREVGLPAETVGTARLRRQVEPGCSMLPVSANRLGEESKAGGSGQHFRSGMKDSLATGGTGACSGLPAQSNSSRLACDGPAAPGPGAPQRTGQRSGVTAGRGGETLRKSGFVHAQFVPAESRQRGQVLPACGKTKVAKIKRRNGETARVGKRPPTRVGGAMGTPVDRSSVMATAGVSPEPPGRSCSESSLHPTCHGLVFQGLALHGVPKAGEQGSKAKQRRWQSSVEIFTRTPAGRPCHSAQRPRAGRIGAARAASFSRTPRSRPGARSESDQSEYSAECASLFHSTIAESSGDELSDHTANCFGDGEGSGSEGGPSMEQADGSALVWPQGSASAESLSATGWSRRSEARICRIKASKALKKKIRRFQPQALKVMTMV